MCMMRYIYGCAQRRRDIERRLLTLIYIRTYISLIYQSPHITCWAQKEDIHPDPAHAHHTQWTHVLWYLCIMFGVISLKYDDVMCLDYSDMSLVSHVCIHMCAWWCWTRWRLNIAHDDALHSAFSPYTTLSAVYCHHKLHFINIMCVWH